MKTDTTKKLEQLLLTKFNRRSDFFVFECTIDWYGTEIVDCISYNCNREISCYEIKQSVSDFHSKSAITFIGNKNYYVMPLSLYEKVKDEIPNDIGVYVACKRELVSEKTLIGEQKFLMTVDGFDELYCIKTAKRRRLYADKEIILSSMLRCACRDRYRCSMFAYDTETEEDSK